MTRKNPVWRFASFREGETWAEDAEGPLGVGLRHGLLAAMKAYTDKGYVLTDSTELGVLLTSIYTLKDMLSEGREELSWMIAEARAKGASWGDIASALGVTRQAAHKHYASLVEDNLDRLVE